MRKKDGQILILVLLVVVVALAVGLSVASRNLTNLRTSTQAEQSQRAFTAAEGGVEDVLSRLNTVANVMGSATDPSCTKVSSTQANCALPNQSTTTGVAGNVNVLASTTYQKTVEPGDVAQINLVGAGAAFVYFYVDWGTNADSSSETASMEFTFICGNATTIACTTLLNPGGGIAAPIGTSYSQVRYGLGDGTSHSTNQTGFTTCDTTGSYHCRTLVKIFNANSNFILLRLKPFWNRATIKVTPVLGIMPVQTYAITSVATTDTGVSRKVQVSRDALPQLPAVFDYVLYSGGNITK